MAAAVMRALVAGGCASRRGTANALRVPVPAVDAAAFRRVLVAGFVADSVSGVNVNEETWRLMRAALRRASELQVVGSDPLAIALGTLQDVPFWRRVGEEYAEPVIVTGVVSFRPATGRFEERTLGRQTVRVWRPGFGLSLRLVLIDGRTGQTLATRACGPAIVHARTGREPALASYFRSMDQAMPALLATLGVPRPIGASRVRCDTTPAL